MDRATLINAGLFQLVWFGSVIGGGVYQTLAFAVGALVLLILSLGKARGALGETTSDLWLVMLALPAGWLLDTTWIQLGVLDFGDVSSAPTWILLMWIGVALTINHSLRFLRDRPLFGASLVGLCAPLSYLGGERLGGVVVPDPVNLWMVSLAWALLFFVLFRLALRIDTEPATAQTAP